MDSTTTTTTTTTTASNRMLVVQQRGNDYPVEQPNHSQEEKEQEPMEPVPLAMAIVGIIIRITGGIVLIAIGFLRLLEKEDIQFGNDLIELIVIAVI